MYHTAYVRILFCVALSILYSQTFSQQSNKSDFKFVNKNNIDLFGKSATFIENIGQYGETVPGHPELGKILFGFEGLDMPVLFTTKAIVYLQRKKIEVAYTQLKKIEENGENDDKDNKELLYTDRIITMEWRNANASPGVLFEEPLPFYYTYGMINKKAKGFKKIIYKQMYPGIDVVYSFIKEKQGFEYSLVIQPGADVKSVSLKFAGDVKTVKLDDEGDLVISSDILSIRQTSPRSFYCEQCTGSPIEKTEARKINSGYEAENNIVRFVLDAYDKKNTILIDPFVTSTSNLTGMNAGIAKDIDFDYEGNIYVAGGGDLSAGQLAKFSSSGTLLWTFSGRLANPAWNFGGAYGGWVVEKTTGNIYAGQGGSPGFQVIRLNTLGIYDNYITVRNPNFLENWKMAWNCDGGTPKIFIAGGGTSDNINLGVCTPPSTSLTSLNLTGQPGGHQDISDLIIDPRNNEMYTIFSQNYIPNITESNRLYKHKVPYNAAAKLWTRTSGFTSLTERANRPYLSGGLNENSVNMLAVNTNYFFYYDGRNLKAMSKATGNDLGTGITLPSNNILLQGGIVADECNNVYIGSSNGQIKVYKFNGSSFDDAAATDITITGFSSPVYDLVYDDAKSLIYASGKGFVASVSIASYCAANIYNINIKLNCPAQTVTANINPSVPAGATITYILYNGSVQVDGNSNGIFTNLKPGIVYTVRALVDKDCGGAQALANFNLNNCSPNTGPGAPGIYIPNAFSPNNDGLNDILKAIPNKIKEFKYFSLYNRWGEMVFTTSSLNKGWDGIYKGHKQNTGVYAWIAEVIDFEDKLIKIKGTTLLIR